MGATTFKKIDRQRFKKLYPAYRKTPRMATISDKSILLESATITCAEASGQTRYIYQFDGEFESVPTITYGITSEQGDMIILRMKEITTQRVVLDLSAPFDGTINLQVIQVVE
jgi:hypothetical protein